VLVYDIKWKYWGYNGAEGTGTYSENLCEPSCAEGKRVEEEVDLYLNGIEIIEGERVLRYLSVNTRNGALLPNGDSFDNWDVAEYVVNMKDFEDNG
jgi:hypothetical protein